MSVTATSKQFNVSTMDFNKPCPRAPRPLKLRELRTFTDAELIARAKYLRFGDPPLYRPILKNQAALVVRVQRERHPHPADLRGNYDPEAAQ